MTSLKAADYQLVDLPLPQKGKQTMHNPFEKFELYRNGWAIRRHHPKKVSVLSTPNLPLEETPPTWAEWGASGLAVVHSTFMGAMIALMKRQENDENVQIVRGCYPIYFEWTP